MLGSGGNMSFGCVGNRMLGNGGGSVGLGRVG